jgi:hypothetical protein
LETCKVSTMEEMSDDEHIEFLESLDGLMSKALENME